MNFAKLTTADLIVIHNVAAAATVKRFSDRATAEKRTAAAIGTDEGLARLARSLICPNCGGWQNDITVGRVANDGTEAHMHEATCHVCGFEFHAETGRALKVRAKGNSAAATSASASWARPEVRAARVTRCPVRVVGKGEFPSMRPAFRALGLPMGCMIKTRMALKAARRIEVFGHTFEAI